MRHVFCTAAIVSLLYVSIIPGNAQAAARRPYGGDLKIASTEKINTTDPALVSTTMELELARQIHETLYRISPDGTVVPALAQQLPKVSEDRTELVIRLRPGLKFHDGSSISSSEVLASWRRVLSPSCDSPHWWLLAPIKGALEYRQGKSTKVTGLERINKLSFRIRLSGPMPNFIEALAAVPTAPLPARFLSTKEPKAAHPPGSGPFKWSASRSTGESMVFDAFLGHSKGRPYLDSLSLVPYSSTRAASLAFELEEVHVSQLRPSHRVGSHQVDNGPQAWMTFLALNPKRLEQLPQGFHKAVENAVDRESLVNYLVGDRGSPTDEVVGLPENNTANRELRANPKAAKEYFKKLALEEMGIPPGLVFLVQKGQVLDRPVAERIQVNLVDIGVVVSVIELERETFNTRIKAGDYDFFLAQPLSLAIDHELQLLSIVAKTSQNSEIEDLLRSLNNLPGDSNRAAIVREMARRHQVRLPWIPLFQHGRRVYLNKSVQGYKRSATGQADLAEAWSVE